MSEITTYTGKLFDPTNPNIDGIDIVDIAHALSLLCRGNGHVKHFYSVANILYHVIERQKLEIILKKFN